MAARERLTERGFDPKTAARSKMADPYLMNQERRPGSNPATDAYESGNPSSWAEDVHQDDIWKQEYAKGRNETGIGNFLDSTWKDREHPGTPGASRPQYENRTAGDMALRQAAEDRSAQLAAAKKIAAKALHLAHAMFPEADEDFVMAQARDFMRMPEASLDTTISRIVGAGEVPEALKKDEKEEGDKESSATDRLASLKTNLAMIKAEVTAGEEEEEEGDKEAQLQMIANLEDRLASLKTNLAVIKAEVTAGEEEEEEEADKESSISELDIELASPEMDVISTGDGDVLDDIFLAAEQKTAAEKPAKKGVSKLGGGGKTASAGADMDLSGLWKSDPDVSGDFR